MANPNPYTYISSTDSVLTDDYVTDFPAVHYDFEHVRKTVKFELEGKARQKWRIEHGGVPPPDLETTLDGQYVYVAYVPPWTAPDWDDERTIVVKPKGGWSEEEKRYLRRDITMRMRPAILAKDQAKNPTPWAKRYGMNPDVSEGRSRMSPPLSDTRRIGLSREMETPSGRKGHIDHRDLAHFASLADFQALINPAFPVSEENLEVRQAMRQLHENMVGDEDWQRVFMRGQTTDERLRNLYHTLDEDLIFNSDLDGPLHPLIQKDKWRSPSHRGGEEASPRYLYNLSGRRGEYHAGDDLFWCAIQPALQLVTRILNSRPPLWQAILDIYTTRIVDDQRDPRLWAPEGSEDANYERHQTVAEPRPGKLVCVYDGSGINEPALSTLLQTIQATGYRSERHIEEYLNGHVCWEVTTGFQFSCENPDFSMRNPVTWGMTSVNYPTSRVIEIEIAAEAIWPLLVDDFTKAEKAVASFSLACIMLHELAHGLLEARAAVFFKPSKNLPILYPEDAAMFNKAGLLQNLDALAIRSSPEPYWRDEPSTEMGFAFENTLFGGNVHSSPQPALGMFPWFLLHVLDNALLEWPSANPYPRQFTDFKLMDPPFPLDRVYSCFQMTEIARFFQKSFWSGEFLKYGRRSLHLALDQPPKVMVEPSWMRPKDLLRWLGKSACTYMRRACGVLNAAGQAMVAQYIAHLQHESVWHVWVRKRWSIQHKRLWRWHDVKWREQIQTCNTRSDTVAAWATEVAHAPTQAPPRQTLVNEVRVLIDSVMDAIRHLSQYIRLCQHYVVEYLRLEPQYRLVIWYRHGLAFQKRMNLLYAAPARDLAQLCSWVLRTLAAYGLASNDYAEVLTVLPQRLTTLADAYDRTALLMGQNGDSSLYLTEENFTTVSSGALQRQSKKYEKLAIKEMQLMPPYLREVAEACLEILGKSREALKQTSVDDLAAILNSRTVRRPSVPAAPRVASAWTLNALNRAIDAASHSRSSQASSQAPISAIDLPLLKNLGIDTPTTTPNNVHKFGFPSNIPRSAGPAATVIDQPAIPSPFTSLQPQTPVPGGGSIFQQQQNPGWNQQSQTAFAPDQGPTYSPFGTGFSTPATASLDSQTSLLKRKFDRMFGEKNLLREYQEKEDERIKRVKMERERALLQPQVQAQGQAQVQGQAQGQGQPSQGQGQPGQGQGRGQSQVQGQTQGQGQGRGQGRGQGQFTGVR